MSKVKELSRDEETQKKIKSKLRDLNKIFKDMDENKKKTVNSLIENVAFMSVMLDELQEHIAVNGTTSEYQNGANQWGTKKSPEVEVYNSMIKNHMNAIRQLTDLLKEDGQEPDDGFEAFLNSK